MQETWVQSLGQEDPLEKRISLTLLNQSFAVFLFCTHSYFSGKVIAVDNSGDKQTDLSLASTVCLICTPNKSYTFSMLQISFNLLNEFDNICKNIVLRIHHPSLCIFSIVVVVLVAQSCLTLCDPADCSSPGFSVLGILQARILEWVAICCCRGSS